MRNAPELSPRQKVLVSAALVAGALGLAACLGENTSPEVTTDENPSQESVTPDLNLYNNLNPEGIEQLCLVLRNSYRVNLGLPEDDLTGGPFQEACLSALTEINGPTTCSTRTNAEDVGFKAVQTSFKNANLSRQALHANARQITKDGKSTAWTLCNNPNLVNH